MFSLAGGWQLSADRDPAALAVVDGLGPFAQYGPHYSRRTPGATGFCGVGRELVLIHESRAAVWAVVEQRPPAGAAKLWRNNVFRRLPPCPVLASDLIRSATELTYELWQRRYGDLPQARLRTEVDTKRVASRNPGFCYKLAGWKADGGRRSLVYLWAPPPA